MTGNFRTADFVHMLNVTGMVRVVFAVPCPIFSFRVLGYQAGMFKRSQIYFFSNFYVVLAIFPKIKGRL